MPEKGWHGDAGLVVQTAPARFELSYFLNQTSDLIQLLQTSQFTVQAQNLSKGLVHGVETALSWTLFDHLDAEANYTFQWAKDISGLPGRDGKFLPGRPMHEASLRLTGHVQPVRVFTEMTYQDDNYLDTANLLRVNNRFFASSGVVVKFFRRFTASFEAKNLLNNRIEDLVGFPLPGRSFYGRLEFEL